MSYFDVSQSEVRTSQGAVSLPILYYNSASVIASFLVDPERTVGLLPETLVATQVFPGKTLVSVAFFHYVDSSVGPYHEMGLAIAARPRAELGFPATAWQPLRSPLPSMYILDLPVTTAMANAAGREIWGYPKIVVPIDFQLRAGEIDCAVYDSGASRRLCHLHGRAGFGLPLPAPNLITLTCLDGRLLRTLIDMRGRVIHAGVGSLRLDCEANDHPLSQHLCQLGLHTRPPLLVQYGQGLQARLPAGEAIEHR